MNNKPTYIEALTFQDPDLTTPEHDEIMCWLDEQMTQVVWTLFGVEPTAISKTWEYPVMHRTHGYNGNINKSKVGHVDMLVRFKYLEDKHERTETVIFEVKPKIQSLGELLRQIRHYQTYLKEEQHDLSWCGDQYFYVVVSKDDRFVSQLESQDVGFIVMDDGCSHPYPIGFRHPKWLKKKVA
jgi:hypothetical protein